MGFFKKYEQQQKEGGQKSSWRPEYKKFRVKSSIKSFRDLEVYKQTTQLCVEIFQFELPETIKNRKKLTSEIEIMYELAKNIPRLIAESYGDKFNDLNGSLQKLEKAMQIISDIITKVDFLVASVDSQEVKETLNKILKKYQTQRVKIFNLKRAWDRVFNKTTQKQQAVDSQQQAIKKTISNVKF
ncbi:MAG: hypothetical protein HY738_13250 [Bacteroidia bacterium]|nr:hypothetical protein [Bacteroidia bacterium]